MTETMLKPAETEADIRTLHTRCCKPTLKNGLCGAGGPVSGPVVMAFYSGCHICDDLWPAHEDVCPRDSGLWP